MNKNIRYLGMHRQSHQYWLDIMTQSKYAQEDIDCYNRGPLIDLLEKRIAKILGKEKALFVHKGSIAQLIAMKVACETSNNNKVILHPKSHIAIDEENAYQALTGLNAITIGNDFEPFDFSLVKSITEKVATLTVEMPLRRVGFKLTPWNELTQMSQWSKEKNTHFHMDGARLWESSHYYNKSYSEISNLFDSVYVSLYKGLGGLNGSVLAGTSKFIEKCKLWRNRMGGNLWSSFPMLITALEGMDNNLDKIPLWVERAHELAKSINKIDKISANIPHANAFLIFIEGDRQTLNNTAEKLTQELGIRLFFSFNETANPNIQVTEIQVGASSTQIATKEILIYFEKLIGATSP